MYKFLILLIVLFIMVLADAKVVEMTDGTFYKRIKEQKLWLVVFHAKWCPHCRTFLKKLDPLSMKLEKIGVHVALIDGSENPSMAVRFSVKSFPSLFFLDPSSSTTWIYSDNDRSHDAIVEYASGGYVYHEELSGVVEI